MTHTKLKQLLAQGALNYYSKHVDVICEGDIDTSNVFVRSYIDTELHTTCELQFGDDYKALHKEILNTVEELKSEAYLNV